MYNKEIALMINFMYLNKPYNFQKKKKHYKHSIKEKRLMEILSDIHCTFMGF